MKRYHKHVCACGDYFVCTQEGDHCTVAEPWECANCVQQQLDEWAEEEQRRERARRRATLADRILDDFMREEEELNRAHHR